MKWFTLRTKPRPSRTEEQLVIINANRADLDAYAAKNLAERERVMWTGVNDDSPCGLCGHPQGFHADDRDEAHGGRMMYAYYDGLCIVPDCHLCDSTGYVPSQPLTGANA